MPDGEERVDGHTRRLPPPPPRAAEPLEDPPDVPDHGSPDPGLAPTPPPRAEHPLRTLTRRTFTIATLAAATTAAVRLSGSTSSPPADRVTPLGTAFRDPSTAEPATPSGAETPTATSAEPTPAATSPQLPRGGRTLFPTHRVVAYCGLPGAPALGRLGVGRLPDRLAELEQHAAAYAGRGTADARTPLPALELIAVVAQSRPGRDGRYRVRVDADVVDAHLAAARRARALLLLGVQPGRASFVDEVAALEPWLREPDVGVALDPEWAVRGRSRPGTVLGHVDGAELDDVSALLAGLVAGHDLPEKLMVVHVLAPRVLRDPGPLRRRPGVSVVRSADGIGTPAAKQRSWRAVQAGGSSASATSGAGVMSAGFKLFFTEDARGPSRLMTPAEVLTLTPSPDYVCYE